MKVVIFNGSGILLKSKKSGISTLARKVGKRREAIEQEKKYKKIRLKKPWGLDVLAQSYKGVSKKIIDKESKSFVNKHLRKDVKAIINKLKKEKCVIVCHSSELMNILDIVKKKLGLKEVYGNALEFKSGKATGKLKEKVDRFDRARKSAKFIKKNKIKKKDVYIIGDSVTAVPSAKLGTLIMFGKGDAKIKKASTFKINSIKKLLDLIE